MKSIRISAAIIILITVCSIFACKKDDKKLKKDEPPTGIEGTWNGTLTVGAATWNAIGVFTSISVKMYSAYQQDVDTTKQPVYTGTYRTIGDSLYCTMAPDPGGFVQKDAGVWYPAGNNNGLSYPATMSMSFHTLDPIDGYWQLTKE